MEITLWPPVDCSCNALYKRRQNKTVPRVNSCKSQSAGRLSDSPGVKKDGAWLSGPCFCGAGSSVGWVGSPMGASPPAPASRLLPVPIPTSAASGGNHLQCTHPQTRHKQSFTSKKTQSSKIPPKLGTESEHWVV